jgi:hypothetical protein
VNNPYQGPEAPHSIIGIPVYLDGELLAVFAYQDHADLFEGALIDAHRMLEEERARSCDEPDDLNVTPYPDIDLTDPPRKP